MKSLLQNLSGEALLDEFFEELSRKRERFLLLDYDGTLAPFREDRDNAYPREGFAEIIDAIIAERKVTVAIISGRSIADLRRLLGFVELPELWGTHGLERLSADGNYSMSKLDPEVEARLSTALDDLCNSFDTRRIEQKLGSVAFHVRGLPPMQAETSLREIRERWQPLTHGRRLVISNFDGGIELRATGSDKGRVVCEILSRASGDFSAVYMGDDFTDEDAFIVIKNKGLSVLVREIYRPTNADLWLKPEGEMLEFLRRYYQTIREVCDER